MVLTPEAAAKARAGDGAEPRRARRRAWSSSREPGLSRTSRGWIRPTTPRARAPPPTPRYGPSCARRAPRSASFKRFLNTTAYLATGAQARVLPDGTAQAPENAPEVVQRVILAANQIAKFPYKWGGGHGAWRDNGYDCSGSVSFALAGAGLLDRPLTSGLLAGYGAPGPGRWITIYANSGHVFMVVAGLRFDTSGQGRAGTRWQEEAVTTSGYAVRHIPGL